MKFPILFLLLVGLSYSVSAQVVINEVVAKTDSIGGIADEYGEYDDWVELYNNGSSAVNLGGYYMTDNSNSPTKWTIPTGTTIAAEGYLIIWTDKDSNNLQVPLHTNFKLSGDGEMVMLSNASAEYVDSIAFGVQKTNKAFARVPNGTGDFEEWPMSHGVSNNTVSSTQELNLGQLVIFPNPATTNITVQFETLPADQLSIEIINPAGQLMISQKVNSEQELININELAKGHYFLKLIAGNKTILRPFQKI